MAEFDAPLTPARLHRRRELAAEKVTLNGEKAVISGVRKPFATVTSLVSGLSCEWAWETVERIVARDGKFKS